MLRYRRPRRRWAAHRHRRNTTRGKTTKDSRWASRADRTMVGKLGLEAETPRGPLGRGPSCEEHDQHDRENLSPGEFRFRHDRAPHTPDRKNGVAGRMRS